MCLVGLVAILVSPACGCQPASYSAIEVQMLFEDMLGSSQEIPSLRSFRTIWYRDTVHATLAIRMDVEAEAASTILKALEALEDDATRTDRWHSADKEWLLPVIRNKVTASGWFNDLEWWDPEIHGESKMIFKRDLIACYKNGSGDVRWPGFRGHANTLSWED